jgi:hypothetical protein
MVLEPGIAYEMTAQDGQTIHRCVIRRSGYDVARYKGRYFQVFGGIRGGLFLGSVPQGRC